MGWCLVLSTIIWLLPILRLVVSIALLVCWTTTVLLLLLLVRLTRRIVATTLRLVVALSRWLIGCRWCVSLVCATRRPLGIAIRVGAAAVRWLISTEDSTQHTSETATAMARGCMLLTLSAMRGRATASQE